MSAVGVSCRGLVYIYRLEGYDVVALAGVDLDITEGEAVALVGPSGSGKSTLLSVFAGLLPPAAGRLVIGDRDVTRSSPADLAQLRATEVGVVLQGTSRNLLPYLSAEQNVRFAQTAALHAGRNRRELPAARDVLDLVGLSGRARVKRRPHDLTPGERQRLALAVALANGPGLLLADEPTSQLDTRARDEVLAALVAVGQAGTTVVVVTHDPLVGAQMGRTVTIRDGRVGAEGRMGGADYSVVGRDGSLHLPPEVLQVFVPGSLVAVVLEADGTARLLPADASAPSRPVASAAPTPAQRAQAFEPYQSVPTFEPALREPPVFQAAPARPERSVFDATPRSAPPPPPAPPAAPARPAAREPDPAQRDGITGFTTAGSAEFDYWGEE